MVVYLIINFSLFKDRRKEFSWVKRGDESGDLSPSSSTILYKVVVKFLGYKSLMVVTRSYETMSV